MRLELDRAGNVTFDGKVRASGAIPDGQVIGLKAPVSGTYAADGTLALWNSCADVAFASLAYREARLGNRRLRLCPTGNSAILESGASGVKFAANLPNANVQGTYQAEPFAIVTPALAIAYDSATNTMSAQAEQARIAGGYGGDNLALRSSSLTLNYDGNTGKLAVLAPNARATGRYASQDFALESPSLDFTYPGQISLPGSSLTVGKYRGAPRIRWGSLSAALGGSNRAELSDVTVDIGNTNGVSMRFANVNATLGEVVRGKFVDGEVQIAPVPLDIFDASGEFTFANNVLNVFEGAFRLEDRAQEDRFKPLLGRGATMSWDGDLIKADAAMYAPTHSTPILRSEIFHSVLVGNGFADLTVDGLRFDPTLQPDDLTELALGVVANVDGVVSGTGRVDWTPQGEVTSSGKFATEALDLAAPFGPTKGIAGEIVFTDLLAITTAPQQQLTVQSINPGIEVFDGLLNYRLENGQLVLIDEGTWPFMGGTLTLERSSFGFSREEERHFTMTIRGAEAALFLQQFDFANLSASGTFDGELPLIFEGVEGRIVGGKLTARPPGGNLSYVGELTYEDMGAVANFAFSSLRSLDFEEMTLEIDGPLTGDLVTKVQFNGVSQGQGAKQNIITRQVAKLPIQFNVNIKAPFYQLITSLRSLYDPAFVRDPRDVGLVADDQGLPPREADSLQEVVERLDETSSE